jgi:hypothetical protein
MDLIRRLVERLSERHEAHALRECDIFGNEQDAAASARSGDCDRGHATLIAQT